MKSISAFEIIKIGIGPSSSHTMGPWNAAEMFTAYVSERYGLEDAQALRIDLYGSLAMTGKGHGTDVAVMLGFSNEDFRTIDTNTIDEKVAVIKANKLLMLHGAHAVQFNYDTDLQFLKKEALPFHANGMEFILTMKDGREVRRKYYSLGGGFVTDENESNSIEDNLITTPHPCHNASTLIQRVSELGCSISDLVYTNEEAWRSKQEIQQHALAIWKEIKSCVYRGVNKSGVLPGGLSVKRRATEMNNRLLNGASYTNEEEWLRLIKEGQHQFSTINKWISCFAMAVNEENASFSRIVTAPTNGAAGVIPAVLLYGYCFEELTEDAVIRFILVAGEIGTFFKKNATISAAMGGCQAEIGVSSAMAAAGLTEVLGGTPAQVLMAAEIAMEHHLGLTCDPIGGLVQIPCIERNSMGSIKAVTAANIALESDPTAAKVSLDEVIQTMWETAQDMNLKYKETSEAGLASNISVNVSEC